LFNVKLAKMFRARRPPPRSNRFGDVAAVNSVLASTLSIA
jgi:hypothetical protein